MRRMLKSRKESIEEMERSCEGKRKVGDFGKVADEKGEKKES